MISGSRDRTIKIWDLRKLGDEKKEAGLVKDIDAHQSTVYSVCKASDDHFVSGSRDKTIRIYDKSGIFVKTIEFNSFVYRVKSLPDGRILVGLDNGNVCVLEFPKK